MDFLTLRYHYVRERDNSFPRILGTKKENFDENALILYKKNMEQKIIESYINSTKKQLKLVEFSR